MKHLCVDLSLTKKNISFCCFSEDYSFEKQILFSCFTPISFKDKYNFVCFDCVNIVNSVNYEFPILYDVKILYELKGDKFENLNELAKSCLGEDAVLRLLELTDKLKAHINSFHVSRVDISHLDEQDLFPRGLYEEYCIERSKAILELYRLFLFDEHEDILKFYDGFYKKVKILNEISQEPLSVNVDAVKQEKTHHARAIVSQVRDGKAFLKFHIVGAKTGRVGFKKGSFNVYTMPRGLRKCIVAPEGYSIVEFDFKAFQPRLAIFDTKDEEFKDKFRKVKDIYSIFEGEREKNKIQFLKWMYDTHKNEVFEKEALPLSKHKDDLFLKAKYEGQITNRFGRVILWHGEERHVTFQNYITSLEVDSILEVTEKVHEKLRGTKSRILFPYHDALVCLINDEEKDLTHQIQSVIVNAMFSIFGAWFPVDIKTGKNYGEMK